MNTPTLSRPTLWATLAAGALLAVSAGLMQQASPWLHKPTLLVAPMIGDLDPCLLGATTHPKQPPVPATCRDEQGSAAPLIDSTLQALGPLKNPDLELGYTLKVPLLALLQKTPQGWDINREAVQKVVRTLEMSRYPAIVYLYSNHFTTPAPIENELAQDSRNLGQTQQGPLPIDDYYGAPLYPWAIGSTDTPITQRREQVIQALGQAICQRPPELLDKIRGITLLGETHQLYPKFQSGMGYESAYQITDYSPESMRSFQAFLKARFRDLKTLNSTIQAEYHDWAQIQPPGAQLHPTTHDQALDAYAHGWVPVSGWTMAMDKARPPQIAIYVDGRYQSEAQTGLGRQDVAEALPELGTAEVGWRHDLMFSKWSPGPHQIDAYLKDRHQGLIHLGSRLIRVAPRPGMPERPMPAFQLPPSAEAPESLKHYMDFPKQDQLLAYNPLAALWHEFRNQQVTAYISHFKRLVQSTCLAQRPLFTHQLFPYSNPSWDPNRFSVDDSLVPPADLHLGISLYGEASDGRSFFDWHKRHPQGLYGITEFHPLKAMDAPALSHTLSRHFSAGARFISMFMEIRSADRQVIETPYLFGIDPDNKVYGSDKLYQSLKDVIATPRGLIDIPRPVPDRRP